MIHRERIADNVYSFQSDVYAQVNAGAVIGPNWAVVIDTLALPEETLAIRDVLEQEMNIPVRYVINTHSHADHAWGNCFFPGALVIGHELCRQLLDTRGREALEKARRDNQVFRNLKIVLPHLTFREGEITLKVGKKTLNIFHLPGHTPDNIAVLVVEDRVLFTGDTAMALPFIADGDFEDTLTSMKRLSKMSLENIIQGHGDIILRGEIENYIKDNINYLNNIRKVVRRSGRRKYPMEILDECRVEECGKSRILIGGLADELHHRNLQALYMQIYGKPPASPDDDYE